MINENIVEYDRFLNRLLIKHRIGREMDNSPYSEMDNRVENYPNIRKCLIARPINIDELLSHLIKLWPLGARTDAIIAQEFLKNKQSSDILQKFVDDISENTNAEIIEKFIEIAVNAGLKPNAGNGKSTAALFTSVLLSALFPDRFVDFRHKQWDNLFKLLNVTNESLFQNNSTYGERIVEAGKFAESLSKLSTFIKYFEEEDGLWKAAGLAWHFSQPIKGNKRYFVASYTSDAIFRNNLSNMEDVDWKFPEIGDNVAHIEQYKNIIKCVRNGSEVALKTNREQDIEIVFVGQVSSVDIKNYSFRLKRLYCRLYTGYPPSQRPGEKGEWSDILSEITDQKAIKELFYNISDIDKDSGGNTVHINTIYYGPPGTGKTFRLLKHHDDYCDKNNPENESRCKFITFHQSYSYEDFVEGIKPVIANCSADSKAQGDIAYEIRPGVFKEIAERALNDPVHDYALFIDEINRGNVASIFGELITLIEEDKRKDAEHQTCVTLPYSQEKFVVPKNLHIYGAMNTADRSIEALDTALRRRFKFIEIPPRPTELSKITLKNIENGFDVDLARLLIAINDRIEILLDKDHCIGHSYFMKVASLTDLQDVFNAQILPLLQEYFYNDMAKIGMILGDKFVDRDTLDVTSFSKFDDNGEYATVEKFRLKNQSNWSEADFRSIYEAQKTD